MTDRWDTAGQLIVARKRIEKLEGILAGDPNQTATKEQREVWRLSAVRYADRLEERIKRLEEALKIAVQLLEVYYTINAPEMQPIKQALEE